MRSPSGTFLLRFSDSELGGITIAWVAEDPKGQTAAVNCETIMLIEFLHARAATALERLSHRGSVCLSVHPSYEWINQKWCKLESPHFHDLLPGIL